MNQALIVDDNSDLRALLAKALAKEGFSVKTAEDGQDAIEKLAVMDRPFVVLLDLMMPRMDGFQFLEWKKQNGLDFSVIVLSASSYDRVPDGASAYLKKPVDLSELLSLADKLCS